jgi:hypothetical protein
MKVEFSGELDAYGYDTDLCDYSPTIAGRNVVSELLDAFGQKWGADKPEVVVYLGVEPVKTGPLWALHGFKGTEVTPPESPEISVGDWDLLKRLGELDGREVLLVVESLNPSDK